MLDYNPRNTEIQFVKGIGEFRGKLFRRLGIQTVNDLFEFFPREYIHRTVDAKIRNLQVGQLASMRVKIVSFCEITTKKGTKQLKAITTDGDRLMECVWFSFGSWLTKLLIPGSYIWINGQVKEYQGNKFISQPQIQEAKDDEEITSDFWKDRKILPIYSLTSKLTFNIVRNSVYNAFALYHNGIDETLPDFLIKKYSFLERKIALQKMHFTSNPKEIPKVKSRFIYEEFFYLQLMIAKNARYKTDVIKQKKHINKNILSNKLLTCLPFTLTNAQKRVISEIFQDMVSDKPMNRLIQGDVGAGKTIVTLFALLLAIENGYQVALIAPTEILAEQHFKTISRLIFQIGTRENHSLNQNIPINICLIKGGKNKQKKIDKERIENGEINFAIGTHALFQKDIKFKNLSLVVIDEQHRFGVAQRAELSKRHEYPDLLYLSATPIPRSLAMTVFGEMTVSSIDELPPNRKPVKTILVFEKNRLQVYEGLKSELSKGRQIYIVCPLIEESEKVDLQDAETLFEALVTDIFPNVNIALLHGKKSNKEKEQIMEDFSSGKIKILVSTTVIEVGIDVENATTMLIEHAERFGLAQLHQLRGRVGRGGEQSFCYLIAYSLGEMAKERLHTMISTNDGFVIAEKDLELRGAGDMFGTAQSGLPEFKFANLITDQYWLNTAKQDAFFIIDEDFELENEKHNLIKNYYEKYIVEKETFSNF
ncbi:MAG: ATP-dependent DNA helicase RecG [Candidatus Cloacimonetes bacterium]|nr:ATP-dependent DNA helicase RecG [Candidatus Cloacimonadota bacterium]